MKSSSTLTLASAAAFNEAMGRRASGVTAIPGPGRRSNDLSIYVFSRTQLLVAMLLVVGATSSAGTINISASLLGAVPNISNNLYGQLCAGVGNPNFQVCSSNNPGSMTASSPAGSAISSDSGLSGSGFIALTQPGQLNEGSGGGVSDTLNYGVNSLAFSPYLSAVLTSPGALVYQAIIDAGFEQEIQQSSGEFATRDTDFEFLMHFTDSIGSSTPRSFLLDPANSIMSFAAGPGTSGYIWLFTSFYSSGNSTSANQILLVFNNGVVTTSQNSLGLNLPGVGSPASFSVTIPTSFSIGFPAYDPAAGTIILGSADGQRSSLLEETPEPSTVSLAGTGLMLAFAIRLALAAKSFGIQDK